jgi:hypothetical protein
MSQRRYTVSDPVFLEDTHGPVFAWVTAPDTTDLEGAKHGVQQGDGVQRVLFDERDGAGLRVGDVVRVQRPNGRMSYLEWTGERLASFDLPLESPSG